MWTIDKITDDAWNFGESVANGDFGIGINSTIIDQLKDGTTSGFLLENGPVTDQSFAGGLNATTP